MSRKEELNKISNSIKQAIWNQDKNNSAGYIIDLKEPGNIIKVLGNIEETSHGSFEPVAQYQINDEKIDLENAQKQYEGMRKPYVFSQLEYTNLGKLPQETQNIFFNNLFNIEENLIALYQENNKTSELRFNLFKMENERKRLYEEKQTVERAYLEISQKKENNKKQIDEYIQKLQKSTKFAPRNIINKVFNKKEIKELDEIYKARAVTLEKENIENTSIAFDKLLYKNELNKKIQAVEKEISILKEQYSKEDTRNDKKLELLKEKNMLFKVFYIDVENIQTKENEFEGLQEIED